MATLSRQSCNLTLCTLCGGAQCTVERPERFTRQIPHKTGLGARRETPRAAQRLCAAFHNTGGVYVPLSPTCYVGNVERGLCRAFAKRLWGSVHRGRSKTLLCLHVNYSHVVPKYSCFVNMQTLCDQHKTQCGSPSFSCKDCK